MKLTDISEDLRAELRENPDAVKAMLALLQVAIEEEIDRLATCSLEEKALLIQRARLDAAKSIYQRIKSCFAPTPKP